MLSVLKANRILQIPDEKANEYLEMGYKICEASGEIIDDPRNVNINDYKEKYELKCKELKLMKAQYEKYYALAKKYRDKLKDSGDSEE